MFLQIFLLLTLLLLGGSLLTKSQMAPEPDILVGGKSTTKVTSTTLSFKAELYSQPAFVNFYKKMKDEIFFALNKFQKTIQLTQKDMKKVNATIDEFIYDFAKDLKDIFDGNYTVHNLTRNWQDEIAGMEALFDNMDDTMIEMMDASPELAVKVKHSLKVNVRKMMAKIKDIIVESVHFKEVNERQDAAKLLRQRVLRKGESPEPYHRRKRS